MGGSTEGELGNQKEAKGTLNALFASDLNMVYWNYVFANANLYYFYIIFIDEMKNMYI